MTGPQWKAARDAARKAAQDAKAAIKPRHTWPTPADSGGVPYEYRRQYPDGLDQDDIDNLREWGII